MKNDVLKKILPHLAAIVAFLLVSIFFCRPALDGNTLEQHDILGWKGMAQNAFDYKDSTGHFPLWNTNAFSGMPNYLIALEGKSILPDLSAVIGLGLPAPINYFFIACICFYILCLALRLHPVIGILGALAYAFATYNPIIISAGHVTKMFAIAYMPLLLAGLLLTYEKKYWLGLALTTLGTYLQLAANHPQISYYFFIVAGFVTLAYLITWIQKKEWKHIGLAAGITAIAVLAGVSTNAVSLLTTSDYSKATMRGGKKIDIVGNSVTTAKTTGLDTSYAFSYSLGKAEALTVLMPNSFGGNAQQTLGEKSAVIEKLTSKGVPENQAQQFAASTPRFWGNLDSTAGGPLYAGAIICILALIGFVLYKKPLRWALLAVSVLAILMSWGKHFPGLNLFLFNNLPLYNKFRAPSITMVIVQLTIPIAAVIGLQLLLFREKSQELLKADYKKILYSVGGLIAFLVLAYLLMDYGSSIDTMILERSGMSAQDEMGRLILSGLKEDRKAMFGAQLLRTIGFAVLILGLLYLYIKNIIKPLPIIIILLVVNTIDLLVVDNDYLGSNKYVSKDEIESANFTKTPIDQQILSDKTPHFRVYNAGPERFSASDFHVSAFHQSIGGYHPAKLRIYQDIIERYLSGGSDDKQILNMLNTKYIIYQNPQNGQQSLVTNNEAYGPCWLVKNVRLVSDDVQEIQSIGSTNLRDTAIVQQAFASAVAQPQSDSLSSITLSKFDNDEMVYTANCNGPQFAVFSEIYYPSGWNAYIDNKKVEYVKTDYVLRGLSIPSGKHTIRFAFEPASYKTGTTIAFIGSIIVALLVLGGLFMGWRESRASNKQNQLSNKA